MPRDRRSSKHGRSGGGGGGGGGGGRESWEPSVSFPSRRFGLGFVGRSSSSRRLRTSSSRRRDDDDNDDAYMRADEHRYDSDDDTPLTQHSRARSDYGGSEYTDGVDYSIADSLLFADFAEEDEDDDEEDYEEEEEGDDETVPPPLSGGRSRSSHHRRRSSRNASSGGSRSRSGSGHQYHDSSSGRHDGARRRRNHRHHHHHHHRHDRDRHRNGSSNGRGRACGRHAPDPLVTPEMLSTIGLSIQSGLVQTCELVKVASTAASCKMQEASKRLPSSEEVALMMEGAEDKARVLLGSPLSNGDAVDNAEDGARDVECMYTKQQQQQQINAGGTAAGGAGGAGGAGVGVGGAAQEERAPTTANGAQHPDCSQNVVQNVIGGLGCLAVPAVMGHNTAATIAQSPTRPYVPTNSSDRQSGQGVPRGIVGEFASSRNGGDGRPPPSPERVYRDISDEEVENYVRNDNNDNDTSVAYSAATGSMLLGEGLLGTVGLSPGSPPRFIEDERATAVVVAAPTAATDSGGVESSGAATRSISPPLTQRSKSPITATILECATEEMENSILAGSDNGSDKNDNGESDSVAAEAMEHGALQSGDKGDSNDVCNETHEDAFVEVFAADDVSAAQEVQSTSSDAQLDNEGAEGQWKRDEREEGQRHDTQNEKDNTKTTNTPDAVGSGSNVEVENGHEEPKATGEYLLVISNLRLQLDSLQQTATLAQRGWDDARVTLEKERSEAAKVRGELDLIREENATLKLTNATLKDANEELQQYKDSGENGDRKLTKLQEENESLKDELFEIQQQLLKLQQQNIDSSNVTRTLSYDEAPALVPTPPLSPVSASSTRRAAAIPASPTSPSSQGASVPSTSSKETKARIRAERKARLSGARPASRGRTRKAANDVQNPLANLPTQQKFQLPRLDDERGMQMHTHAISIRTPQRPISEKEPKAPTSPTTPSTAPTTPSPDLHDRHISHQQQEKSSRELSFEGGIRNPDVSKPWKTIRSAPLHIIQPPRLLPDILSRSPEAHVVMKYIGPRSYTSDADFTECEFDAAYLNLDDANHRARYSFFVLNAMGREVEDLLDDPSVMVGTTDGGGGSNSWGECLKLTYRYKDWDGRKMMWKVWVVPAGGQQPRRERTEPNSDSMVRKVTSQGPNGSTMKMFV